MEYSLTFEKTEDNLFILRKMVMAVSNSLYDWLLSYHVEIPLTADVVEGSLRALDETINKMKLGQKCLFNIFLKEKLILVHISIGSKNELVKIKQDKDNLLVHHFNEKDRFRCDENKQKQIYSKKGIRLLYKREIQRRK